MRSTELLAPADFLPTRRQLAWLIAIVAGSIGLRVASLYWQMSLPSFHWSDPDRYLLNAASLTRSGHWRWTVSAIRYDWGGVQWVLPPAYPIFLSFFYRANSLSPMAAALAQCVVGGASTIPIFLLARSLHTVRAGLVAAFIWAIWFPGMAGVGTFVQEQLYIPLLVTAFAALAVCLRRQGAPGQFALAGVCFGVASLTRAMPLFFMVWLVPLVWLLGPSRAIGLRRALALLAGFLLLVAPYVSWLSLANGELVLIDNHMSILHPTTLGTDAGGVWTTIDAFARDLVTVPGAKLDLARGLFRVYGLSWLYHYGAASSAFAAWLTGVLVHVCLDTLFVFACVLAPIGFAVARQRQVGFVLISWAAFVVVASAAANFTGPRYRAPFEAVLICGAAVLGGGRWGAPGRWMGLLGVSAALGFAVLLGPAYLQSWQARVPYGFDIWTKIDTRFETRGQGATGFYVPSAGGTAVFDVEPVAGTDVVTLIVKLEGVPVRTVQARRDHPAQVRLQLGDRPVAFVELVPQDGPGSSGAHSGYYIRTIR